MQKNPKFARLRAQSTRSQRQFFARRALMLKLFLGMAVGFGFNYSVFENLTISAAVEPQYIAGVGAVEGTTTVAVTNEPTPSVVVETGAVKVLPADSSIQLAATQKNPTAVGSIRNRYAYGNCTYYVASRRAVPSNWGNARTWLPRAQAAGWHTGTSPAIGAIGWTPAGWYGHVVIVEAINGNQVLVAEMNYAGWNRVGRRWAPASSFRYIY